MITKLMQEIKERLDTIDKYLKEKEYLRVEERTLQLMQEKLDNQRDYEEHLKKEIERLNNIIEELEKWIRTLNIDSDEWYKLVEDNGHYGIENKYILDKLKELKGE